MANRNFSIPPPTLMEAFVDDVADDRRGGFLDGRLVVLSGDSVGVKYGGYNEDQCDEADDEVAPRSVTMSKGDRMRKVEKRAFAKRGCFSGKHGLGF